MTSTRPAPVPLAPTRLWPARTRTALALLLAAAAVPAQDAPPMTVAPEREKLSLELLLQRGGELLAPPATARWLPEGHRAAFVEGDPPQLVLRTPGADTEVLAPVAALVARLGLEGQEDEAPQLPPWSMLDAATLRCEFGRAVWHVPIGDGDAARVLEWPEADPSDYGERVAVAPGDGHVAWVRAGDLNVGARDGGVRRITWDGGADIVYGDAAHRAEFGIQRGLFWSDDGRWLAFYREDQRGIAGYPYQDLDAMPPAPRHGRYPMSGRAHGKVTVGVYDTATTALVWLAHDPDQDPYWTNLTFTPDAPELYVALVSRGQDRVELVRFDCATGERGPTVLTENDPEWIEPEHGPRLLDGGRFVWWSGKDGWRHLYLHDRDGRELLQLTRGPFDVQELLGVAPDRSALWFAAAGDDPRQLHLFRAALDGSGVRQLSQERGSHEYALAPDARFAFATWSNTETPPQPRFVDLGTGAVEALPSRPSPLLEVELPDQRAFQIDRDDGPTLYGNALLPRGAADAGTRLPALLYVYGGPHVQLVKDRWLAGASPLLHALANRGYVVCRLDNRGTPNRGQAFEQAVFRQLGTLEVEDQLHAVDWLRSQPFVDADRIAVHGWSFGGYMTLRLLLAAPGTFRCGISGAPVTDWAMYETGYTERYMDTPQENAAGYEASSCLPIAGRLRDPLLLVHGTDDRTVMWSHSLAFVDRCVDEGVFLDYFPYPMQTHGLRGKDAVHFQRLLGRYLDRHLRGTGD
ncbi:MAG: DPP IV N-terminal domain-containing protein [Planctomycetota bacterium]